MKKSTTLKTVEFASQYYANISKITHIQINGEKVCFYANNKKIASYLQRDLTKESFKELFALCEKQGVFDLHFSNHIPSVTFNAAAKHMTRKWPRDHIGMMALIEDKYPQEVWGGLVKWAEAYSNLAEVRAFERVLRKPLGACYNKGVAHTFWMLENGELKRDAGWKMHQRIESHGELLRALAKFSKERLKNNKNLPDCVVKTIVRFVHYLYIQGLSPQSCGAWEEIPFKNGINWDNASVMKAFEEVNGFIEELEKHPKIKNQIICFEQDLCKKFKLRQLLGEPDNLKEFMANSLKQIRRFYLDEFHGATKRVDSSSVMFCAEDIDLSSKGNLMVNISKHLRILNRWEKKSVHEFGAWRYNNFEVEVDGNKVKSCDSYLNLNYYILCNGQGQLVLSKKDADQVEKKKTNDNGVCHFKSRGRNAKEKTSAQWGLPLSYAAIAYGKMTEKLLDERDRKGRLTEKEEILLKKCMNKSQEYIKRTYGNISGCFANGDLFLKADGQPIEPFRKPEAYQAVTSKLNTKQYAFIPGVNDHLGWDAAKCYEASKLFLKNLQRI